MRLGLLQKARQRVGVVLTVGVDLYRAGVPGVAGEPEAVDDGGALAAVSRAEVDEDAAVRVVQGDDPRDDGGKRVGMVVAGDQGAGREGHGVTAI